MADLVPAIHVFNPAETSTSKAIPDPFTMFPGTTDQVAGDADINIRRAIRPVRHDGDPASHARMMRPIGKEDVDGRREAGHDDEGGRNRNFVRMGPRPRQPASRSSHPSSAA
jgi:hypothetical protein